jgi:hypothetical protein
MERSSAGCNGARPETRAQCSNNVHSTGVLMGRFTNQVERQCALYEAKGIVRVQGETPEASRQPFADVKVFQEQVKDTGKKQ